MKIYNTLTRRKEEFVPLTPGEVRMYVCGVTVYDLCHIGHARSAIVFDVIRRYFHYKGYRVTFVKNFTDVDDKIINRAQQEGVPALEVSERFIREFREDMAAIGVWPAHVEPKATEHISEMIALIERLIAGGFAYVVDGDVYFEIRRFPPYGRLSGKNLDELLAGARVDVDERKRDPRDFALWKAAKPGEPSWPSRWGPGRPGWHVECSAMSMRYLGESFDIHGGGEDLIFPHHECEIAQSESSTGKPFARYWIHNGFVNLGAEKMSKSLGNVLAIREVVKRHSADALRLWMLGTHYRHPIEWSEARVRESARALERPVRLLHDVRAFWSGAHAAPELPGELRGFRARFEAAMDDDFNTPQALGAIFDFSRALYERLERAHADAEARGALVAGVAELQALMQALGLLAGAVEPAGPPPEVERLVVERGQARERRDFMRADELRAEIQGLGWAVEDTAAGPRVTRRDA
ncbi:MAG: cysteine--tRNA ligase [Candidatus Rokubacteria bacterium RIFCSPLOWO2_02_FULL_73_56]|nr:MAG: cysteine--tRNA ligase [Candidatus Rokubacteria bacterium RIFCSPHIGHO2_02_FULL_73_26]OGL08979.1 MAG: cysteine--tRNA ligase [Candidatus Rokubacteria bacterium RIFCSPLOWO2_02_FULL_73_56]OGL25083.1 MAG: cysteine--tRNA ligase [Candidatus Rokubacteria bacterium RIFCSPLOWO2_12_FULL_73_47]